MWLIDQLAEARIADAMGRGDFSDLPGAGKPLNLGDDSLIPEELRSAYRLLKNAGFVPPEVETRREIHQLTGLIARLVDPEIRTQALRKLRLLEIRLRDRPGVQCPDGGLGNYRGKVLEKM